MQPTHPHAAATHELDPDAGSPTRVSWLQLWESTRGNRALLAAGIVFLVAQSLAVLMLPWLAGSVVQDFSDRAGIGWVVSLALAVLAAMSLFNLWMTYAMTIVGEAISARMTESMHERLVSLRMGWHARRTRGDCAALIARDVPSAVQGAISVALATPSALVTALGAMALMLSISPTAAVAVLLPLPLFVVALKLAGRRLGRLSNEEAEAAATLDAYASESIHRLAAIKLFNRESVRQDRMRDVTRRWTKSRARVAMFLAKQGAAVAFAACLLGAAFLLSPWSTLLAGDVSLADLVRIFGYATVVIGPLSTLASTFGDIRRLQGSLARIGAVPDNDSPMSELRAALPPVRAQPPLLVLSGVVFRYPGAGKTLLDGVDLVVEPGARVGIVGANGTGKSTIAHLLVRFVDGWEGSIELAGRSIAEMPHGEVRQNIGLVPQFIELFDGSIADNLRIAKPHADAAQLRAVMARVGLGEWLETLPEGLTTPIGENGCRISGGQRQRLAIARALISDAGILVLDEATSMLDAEGENELVALLDRELQGRTVIVVTHRPAALKLATAHYRLEDGRLRPLSAVQERNARA